MVERSDTRSARGIALSLPASPDPCLVLHALSVGIYRTELHGHLWISRTAACRRVIGASPEKTHAPVGMRPLS